MPLKPTAMVQIKTEEEFREIDYRVMGKAFEIHNELGPCFDELVYKNELALRLAEIGICAAREFAVDLLFQTFSKRIFIDLFVESGIVYEIKTAAAFAPAHRGQALNYLFVTGTRHGKLINFRGAKVDGEYISTSLDHMNRQDVLVRNEEWNVIDSLDDQWRQLVIALIADWGSGLNLEWYREALGEIMGGLSRTATEIPLVSKGRQIGSHSVRLLTLDTMWTLTAIKESSLMKEYLLRFLGLSCLKRIQWANYHNHHLVFQTLIR